MVALALERQPERRGRVRPAILLPPRGSSAQRDVALLHLAQAAGYEISRVDGRRPIARRCSKRVDGLGAGRLEEQLGESRARPLRPAPGSLGEIATVASASPASATWRFADRAARRRHAGIVIGGPALCVAPAFP